MTPVRIGTRGSTLATTQARTVADAVERATGLRAELVTVRTFGDDHHGPLRDMPQPGVFVSALRTALIDGEVDVAVHSMKDLPSAPPEGIVLAATPVREDPRDALVSAGDRHLDALPDGARIGTGSPRRQARLRALRPDLEVVDLRGNVERRLAQVDGGALDAVVLAVAGLARLGRADRISEILDPSRLLPAPAQGVLAVECRAADRALRDQLVALDDQVTRLTAVAERGVLAALSASCASAIGAAATIDGRRLRLVADASGPDGEHAEATRSLELPAAGALQAAASVGHSVAEELLAAGADRFLVR